MLLLEMKKMQTMSRNKAEDTEVHAGQISHSAYPSVAQQICKQFDNVEFVAITLRESISANENNWGAMLYEKASNSAFFSPLNGDEYSPFAIITSWIELVAVIHLPQALFSLFVMIHIKTCSIN